MAKSKASQLDDYLTQQESVPFDWTAMNCCHFAQGWVQLMEPHVDIVPKRDGKVGMLRAIQEAGGMRKGISESWGRWDIPAPMAHPGDVVLFDAAASERSGSTARMLGICTGRTAACKGEDGSIVHVPMELAVCAWPVGR